MQLLNLLVYQPETYTDISKWGYSHCIKILSKKSLILKIVDDVIPNQEWPQNGQELEAALRLGCTNIPKMMLQKAFFAKV